MAATGDYTIADLAEMFTVSRDRVPDPPASPGGRQSQVTSPSRYLALREHRTRTADPGLRPITVTWP